MEKEYIIGTRGSLLALTQCLQFKALLEERGIGKFKLKIISTRGDENTKAPLWQLEGKDFFTRELDAALLQEEVDLVVHSYKDLGSERPKTITLAAIPKRKYAHDILFIKEETIEKLQQRKMRNLKVGTSSPRRIRNITSSLPAFLPYGNEGHLNIECLSLRGNVNTRLEKLLLGEFDAIVLALPGVERLAQGLPPGKNEASQKHGNPREILQGLLKDLNYMILPLSQFPAAASQGALGIECLENRPDDLLEKLGQMTCPQTKREVAEERKIFQSFGGGCHLAVGISAREHKGSKLIHLDVKGEAQGKSVERHNFIHRTLPPPPKEGSIFIGIKKKENKILNLQIKSDELTQKRELPSKLQTQRHTLVTSPSALKYTLAQEGNREKLKENFIWASGVQTMKALAAQGLWVQGSADSFGEEEVKHLSSSCLVEIKSLATASWQVLTNDQSQNILGPSCPVYTREFLSSPKDDPKENKESLGEDYRGEIEKCCLFYWASFPQYEHFAKIFSLSPKALHACGPGKTYEKLKKVLPKVLLFKEFSEFENWITQEQST